MKKRAATFASDSLSNHHSEWSSLAQGHILYAPTSKRALHLSTPRRNIVVKFGPLGGECLLIPVYIPRQGSSQPWGLSLITPHIVLSPPELEYHAEEPPSYSLEPEVGNEGKQENYFLDRTSKSWSHTHDSHSESPASESNLGSPIRMGVSMSPSEHGTSDHRRTTTSSTYGSTQERRHSLPDVAWPSTNETKKVESPTSVEVQRRLGDTKPLMCFIVPQGPLSLIFLPRGDVSNSSQHSPTISDRQACSHTVGYMARSRQYEVEAFLRTEKERERLDLRGGQLSGNSDVGVLLEAAGGLKRAGTLEVVVRETIPRREAMSFSA